MASQDATQFGGGRLFFSALRVWRDNLLVLTGLAFLMNLALYAVGLVLLTVLGLNSTFLDLIFGPLIGAILMLVAADVVAGQQVDLRAHINRVSALFAPLVILSLAVAFLAVIGLMALIIPGLYVVAVFIAVTPLILFENAGWDALRRSFELCKSHVLPIIGVLLRLGVLAILVMAPVFLMTVGTASDGELVVGPLVPGLEILTAAIFVLLSSATSSLATLLVLMIYHRLKDLTEGVSHIFD